jgi:hypothetical protein
MNITSVNGQELYQILFGRETATNIKISVSDECKQRAANDGGRVDKLEIIEKSQVKPCVSSISSLFETGNKIYAYAYRINIFKTDDDFAKHYGEIGKRLDTAYAEGKFTEDEYKELNESLAEYIQQMKHKNDFRRAELELANSGRRFAENKTTGNLEEDKIIMENFFAEKQKAIDSILNRKGFVTEFAKIMEMINKTRDIQA